MIKVYLLFLFATTSASLAGIYKWKKCESGLYCRVETKLRVSCPIYLCERDTFPCVEHCRWVTRHHYSSCRIPRCQAFPETEAGARAPNISSNSGTDSVGSLKHPNETEKALPEARDGLKDTGARAPNISSNTGTDSVGSLKHPNETEKALPKKSKSGQVTKDSPLQVTSPESTTPKGPAKEELMVRSSPFFKCNSE